MNSTQAVRAALGAVPKTRAMLAAETGLHKNTVIAALKRISGVRAAHVPLLGAGRPPLGYVRAVLP